MAVNLKQLAILTSAYTGIKVWPIEADILSFCQLRMGGNWTDLRQIRVNADQLKQVLKDEWTNTWTELYEESLEHQLHESNEPKKSRKKTPPDRPEIHKFSPVIQLSDSIYTSLSDYAEEQGWTIDECIEEIIKVFIASRPIKVEVEI